MKVHGLKEAGLRSGPSLERRRRLQSSQGMSTAGNALRCRRERRDARREQAAPLAVARRRTKGDDEDDNIFAKHLGVRTYLIISQGPSRSQVYAILTADRETSGSAFTTIYLVFLLPAGGFDTFSDAAT